MTPSDLTGIAFCGYISVGKSQVDSVHVGMAYRLFTDRDDVRCLEPEKLTGRWQT